jgi:EAL domain-containing protein (putative c-di-GMP-specific phosphodiesterase class I)
MARAGGRVLSIARAAVRAGWHADAHGVPPELRVALLGLNRADADLVERLLSLARGTRYACVRIADTGELVPLARAGLVDAVLVDLDARRREEAGGVGAVPGGRIPTLALLDDWHPGEEDLLLAAGIDDVLEKEELEPERLDRALRLAVARARAAGGATVFGWPDRTGDGWGELRVLVARAVAAHARQRRCFALLRIEMSPPPASGSAEASRWERARSLLAERLRARLRRSDPLLEARPGCFAVLVEDLAAARDAVTVACKLEPVLCEPLRIGGEPWRGELRLAWAVFPDDATDGEALLDAAANALSAGNDGSGPQRFVHPELARAYARAHRLGPAFARALAADGIGLVLQPQTTLGPGPVGLTALPCWQPEGEAVLHLAQLREIGELTGRLDSLTRVLLALACRQLARWHAEGLTQTQLGVPVLSRRQLARSDLPEALRAATAAARVPPERLELELPARMFGGGDGEEQAVLRELAATGVRLAMRVEPGNLPLAALRGLPLRTLKLPAALLGAEDGDHRAMALLRGLGALARSLGLRLVAEDAIDPVRMQRAREIGCDAIQAVTSAPPLPEPEARRWLLRAHRRPAR